MQNDLLRIALAGFGDIQEWRLADADRARELGYPRRFETPLIDDWATVFVDLTLDVRDGKLLVHALTTDSAEGLLSGEMDRRVARLEGADA